jgi:hypothetical protein
MIKRITLISAILVSLAVFLGMTVAGSNPVMDEPRNPTGPAGLTAHEWGTFTTVAGVNGETIDWLPLSGPTDLPCFVKHFDAETIPVKVVASPPLLSLSYTAARSQLIGSVRMETPVLYFYSANDQILDVTVGFPRGIVTEWYPTATVKPTAIQRNQLTSAANTRASVTWNNVRVMPQAKLDYLKESAASHYYAARETDASPIVINGAAEKFLFYRGVGQFPAPIRAIAQNDGKILLKNLSGIPRVILFESRGGKMGYRIVNTNQDEALVDSPPLTGDFASLRLELEKTLVAQGLYAKEAKAMVDTWRDSWFEEGTRLFYITPSAMVDDILPLSIIPKPVSVARVFVGRIELLTPATLRAVQQAVNSNDDQKALQVYGRFLGPIIERISGQAIPENKDMLRILNAALKSYATDLSSCGR